MSNIIQGVQSAIPQPSTYGYTPGRGYHQRLRWKITNPADIPALLGQLIAAGYAYDVSPEADGAITVVEATSQPAQDTNGDPASTSRSQDAHNGVQLHRQGVRHKYGQDSIYCSNVFF